MYGEMQKEYSEYAKQRCGEAADATRDPEPSYAARGSGKDFGGGEATRDSEPNYADPNDPKGEEAAIHKAESFAEYIAKRRLAANKSAGHEGKSVMTAAAPWGHAIEQAIAPVHYLCVSDVTDGHAIEGAEDGRSLHAEGRDLKVLVVSSRFDKMRQQERQRLVNAVLSDSLHSGVLHSVQMRCWTPEEWLQQGSPTDLGAPGSYSSTARTDAHELGQPLPLPGCTDEPPPEVTSLSK